MADNTQINQGASGDVISTDDLTTQNGAVVSGLKVQRMKAQYGQDGEAIDVSDLAPLPIKEIKTEEWLKMILIELRILTLFMAESINASDNLDKLRSDFERDL